MASPAVMPPVNHWYLENLVCVHDGLALHEDGDRLCCARGHSYPVVSGIPVLLRNDVAPTVDTANASLHEAKPDAASEPESAWHLASLGLTAQEKQGILALARDGKGRVDPVVAFLVAATNGNMYRHLIGKLDDYPIPDLPLPPGAGRQLLDVGCGWGRWSFAGARQGYQVVGIDPSLGSVLAARRVAEQLGLTARFLVADSRHLPFRKHRFDVVFSYSVLQHLSLTDCNASLAEIRRVLQAGGSCVVQMPTTFGLRCLYQQLRRGFRDPTGFEVRYRSVGELERIFSTQVGPARTFVDCYFGIGLQRSDAHLMPPLLRTVIATSELLKRMNATVPWLKYLADSVYVEARTAPGEGR